LEKALESNVVVYTNTTALPRVFVVGAAQVVTATDIPARIARKDFDPRIAVLIEQESPAGFDTKVADRTSPGSAIITSYHNLSVDISADMNRSGWLVLGDVNYPGWHVEVDGHDASIYTAYYILRAVPLSVGKHT